jgi:hypothetical protein
MFTRAASCDGALPPPRAAGAVDAGAELFQDVPPSPPPPLPRCARVRRRGEWRVSACLGRASQLARAERIASDARVARALLGGSGALARRRGALPCAELLALRTFHFAICFLRVGRATAMLTCPPALPPQQTCAQEEHRARTPRRRRASLRRHHRPVCTGRMRCADAASRNGERLR